MTIMESSTEYLDQFLDISDKVDVVLACRVSPKQKGDIVSMIQVRFPKKITLSIGDGANDVAMIMKAHVGVGIAGREGMQAARTADFAMGKFKYLRPLLFAHGREAYRRNSDIVLYSFYKNVLYVIVQFQFGAFSVFSGQTLYEPWIYQLYNMNFTGLPVQWYALFDWQYPKQQLVDQPIHYRLGMENRCFSTEIFWGWLIYAFFQGIMVLFIGIVFPCSTATPNGKEYFFWDGGHFVYFLCIFLVSAVLLKKTNNHNVFGTILIFVSATSFFWVLYLECKYLKDSDVYDIWTSFVSSPTAWIGSILVLTSLWTIDPMASLFYEKFCEICCNKKKNKTAPGSYCFDGELEMIRTNQVDNYDGNDQLLIAQNKRSSYLDKQRTDERDNTNGSVVLSGKAKSALTNLQGSDDMMGEIVQEKSAAKVNELI